LPAMFQQTYWLVKYLRMGFWRNSMQRRKLIFSMPLFTRYLILFLTYAHNFLLLTWNSFSFIGNLGLCGRQVGEICKSQLDQPPINIVSLAAPPSAASDHLYGNCNFLLVIISYQIWSLTWYRLFGLQHHRFT
jgi:hypothetical protein